MITQAESVQVAEKIRDKFGEWSQHYISIIDCVPRMGTDGWHRRQGQIHGALTAQLNLNRIIKEIIDMED